MNPPLDPIFRRYYSVAKLAEFQQRAPEWMVNYLREHLYDKQLDILKRKINGQMYWCIVRFSHPLEVFGEFAKRAGGLPKLPVTIYHFVACPVCGSRTNSAEKCPSEKCKNYLNECNAPRSIGIMDIENFCRSPKDYLDRLIDVYNRERIIAKNDAIRLGTQYAAEIVPFSKARSYGTGWMVEENQRRILAGG